MRSTKKTKINDSWKMSGPNVQRSLLPNGIIKLWFVYTQWTHFFFHSRARAITHSCHAIPKMNSLDTKITRRKYNYNSCNSSELVVFLFFSHKTDRYLFHMSSQNLRSIWVLLFAVAVAVASRSNAFSNTTTRVCTF